MSKTLLCEGTNPPHEFTHAGGRGRPPKYCNEHKPVKPVYKSKTENVTVVTDESEAPVNPFIKKAQEAQKAADKKRMEEVRAGKKEKAQARSKATAEEIEQEYLAIDDRIEKTNEQYLEAFANANTVEWSYETEREFNRAWNLCDHKQNALINLALRKNVLEKLVEDLTNPEQRPISDVVDVTETPIRAITDAANDYSAMIENMDDELDAETLAEDNAEDGDGYNDLLSNPEQYDDDNVDAFMNALAEFDE